MENIVNIFALSIILKQATPNYFMDGGFSAEGASNFFFSKNGVSKQRQFFLKIGFLQKWGERKRSTFFFKQRNVTLT